HLHFLSKSLATAVTLPFRSISPAVKELGDTLVYQKSNNAVYSTFQQVEGDDRRYDERSYGFSRSSHVQWCHNIVKEAHHRSHHNDSCRYSDNGFFFCLFVSVDISRNDGKESRRQEVHDKSINSVSAQHKSLYETYNQGNN